MGKNADTRGMVDHVVLEYFEAQGTIIDDLGKDEITNFIEQQFAAISASKFMELFGMTSMTSKFRIVEHNVTPEFGNKKEKAMGTMEESTFTEASDEDVHGARDDIYTCQR